MSSHYVAARLPLLYVFLSGVGFSVQSLIIKVLAENQFRGSFQCIFFRGTVQLIISSIFVYYNEERRAGKGESLFGDSNLVKCALFLRSLTGFGSIAFSFLAVELIPIGDVAVLKMLSPTLTALLSCIFIAEPWRLPEFGA
jgi:drug/metabolite transporter (DMT)-like permease